MSLTRTCVSAWIPPVMLNALARTGSTKRRGDAMSQVEAKQLNLLSSGVRVLESKHSYR